MLLDKLPPEITVPERPERPGRAPLPRDWEPGAFLCSARTLASAW